MKTEKGMLKTQWLGSDRPRGWLRMTCHSRNWTPHLGDRADALVPEPRLTNDGEGGLAFSAGNRNHYTLGCASCNMVITKRLISKVGSNLMLRCIPEPSHVEACAIELLQPGVAGSTYRLGESDAQD